MMSYKNNDDDDGDEKTNWTLMTKSTDWQKLHNITKCNVYLLQVANISIEDFIF